MATVHICSQPCSNKIPSKQQPKIDRHKQIHECDKPGLYIDQMNRHLRWVSECMVSCNVSLLMKYAQTIAVISYFYFLCKIFIYRFRTLDYAHNIHNSYKFLLLHSSLHLPYQHTTFNLEKLLNNTSKLVGYLILFTSRKSALCLQLT